MKGRNQEMHRRAFITVASLGAVTGSALLAKKTVAVDQADPLQRLVDGNRRFVAHRAKRPHQDPARRLEVAKGQKPFAAILSCADSRVPPEVIFDQGLGDLFVVRVAGNIADDAVVGSLEYAVEHLGVKLIFVLGHQRCGAVQAAVDGGKPEGHIGTLLSAIMPAVEKSKGKSGDKVDNAVRENVHLVEEQLKGSHPILEELLHEHKIRVAGGRYDLDTGAVELVS